MAFSEHSSTATPSAFQIHKDDNVATLLVAVEPGPVTIHGTGRGRTVTVRQQIEAGHKIATVHIGKGQEIIKYGVVIGVASAAVKPGEWVHLHNCRSRMDLRSNAFDVHTGLPEDTKYE